MEGEGILMDQYRFRQLMDYQLDLAAKKKRLTPDEAKVLFSLHQCGEFESMRRLSDVADIPLTRLFLTLQKLERKKLVEMADDKSLVYLENGAAGGWCPVTVQSVQMVKNKTDKT